MNIKIYKIFERVLRNYRDKDKYSIDYENAKSIIKNDNQTILIDVRSPQEYREGHLESSINIPLYDLEEKCEYFINKKQNTIIIYCQTGKRSKKAIEILKEKGFENLYQIEGGLDNI